MALSPQWLDELRARVTLSSVIMRTTKLQKAGHEWKACCPFHDEKTPSFTVSDQKGFYHCLAGETVVITANGRFPISRLSGETHSVLSRSGQWIDAKFKEYGEQKLWKISLSRNGVKKQIFATSEHRWFVHDRVSEYVTRQLKPGHALQSALPLGRLDWSLDPEGIRHGIVFGDGTMYKNVYGTLNLHGEKDVQLRQYFPAQEHHVHEREGGALYLRIYGGRAFQNMKKLPCNGASDSYLLGFLAGYMAADGHVAKDGTVMLNSANAETLEAIRDICNALGIVTYGRTTLMRKGYGNTPSALHRIHFLNSSLAEKFFLLSEARKRFAASNKKFARLRWVVRSVEETDRHETVYCAEVPQEHAFALDDHILTGNCFGCGAHGDVIRWMTDQRGMQFMDAVKELAAEAGMEVPAPDPRAAQRAEQRAGLHDVMQSAQDWFVRNLQSNGGTGAREYLKSRGFDAHTIERFGFGYAPPDRQAMKSALSQHEEPMLIEGGLRIAVDDPSSNREPYDRFRSRLMLPIQDARGRVIAFGGRILETDTKAPKYLNSPDTPLFDKGRTLYNLHRAGPASRQTKRMVVVEGYMDVIALAAAGIEDAVAPLGTALTERQLELLWRMVETPILCFDGDAAGQRAAMRAISRALPMLRPSHSLRIVRLPSGLDPDDLLKQRGRAAMDELLDNASTLLDTLWTFERDALPLETPEDKAGLKARLLAHVDAIQDPDIRSLYKRELLEKFSAFAFPPREQKQWPKREWKPGGFKQAPPRLTPEAANRLRRATGSGNRDALTSAVIAGLARFPDQIMRHADSLERFAAGDQKIAPAIDSLIEAAETLEPGDTSPILAPDGNLAAPDETRFSFLREGIDPKAARDDLAEAVSLLVERPALEAALAAATARFETDPEGAFAEQQRLLKRKLEFEKRLGQMVSNRAAAAARNDSDRQPAETGQDDAETDR